MKSIIALGATLMISVVAFGQAETAETQSNSSTETTIKKTDIAPIEASTDIDNEITNKKLRAETGSKSKFSFRSSFNYNGGNLEKPLASDRPQLDPAVDVPVDTALSGAIGVKYRASDRDALSLQVGVAMNRPLEGGSLSEEGKSDVSDPSLTYERLYKLYGVQMVSSAGLNAATTRFDNRRGVVGGWGVGQTAIYSATTKWDLGLALDLNGSITNNVPAIANPYAYQVGLYPFAEYAFNDKYSFRTVFRYSTYTSKLNSPNVYEASLGTQSMGIGIGVTRDIYFYPNVQFVPTNLVSDRTNWGMSANISL